MGCCSGFVKTVLKILLIIFNIIFFILGLILFGLGILVKTTLNQYAKQYIDPIMSSLLSTPSAFGSTSTGATSAPPTVDLVSLLGPIGAAFIAIGLIFLIITFFGTCGACCSSTCMLIIYAVIFGIFILVQVILLGLFFDKKLDGQIRTTLQQELISKYIDVDDYSMASLMCNIVQLQFKCCGIDDYKDYNSSSSWKRTKTLTIGNNVTSFQYTLVTPLTCCKTSGAFPSITFDDNTCATTPTDLNNNWHTGCWSQVTAFLGSYRPQILPGVIIAIVVEVIFVAMACIIACIQSGKIGPAEYA